MTHLVVLTYPGWEACKLDRGFAVWALMRHTWPDDAPTCPVCRERWAAAWCRCPCDPGPGSFDSSIRHS